MRPTRRREIGLDDVDLRKDARGTEPVAASLERRARQDLESQDAAIEVLRPLGVGGHDALVLHADDVGAGYRSNGRGRCL